MDSSIRELKLQALQKKLNEGSTTGLMIQHQAKSQRLTVGEIKLACESNPSHPKAIELLEGVEDQPDEHVVIIDTLDVQAVTEDKEVLIEKTIQKQFEIHTKKLGDSISGIKKSETKESPNSNVEVTEGDS